MKHFVLAATLCIAPVATFCQSVDPQVAQQSLAQQQQYNVSIRQTELLAGIAKNRTGSPANTADNSDRADVLPRRGTEVSIRYAVTVLLLVSGCAATPTGPSVQVMPAPGRPRHLFADDDTVCRHYASGQVDGEAAHANWMQAAVAGGTMVLAGLGAAVGGGHGAAIGAAGGALGGTVVSGIGSGTAQATTQQRYDNAYAACQYARGNVVPGMPQVRGRRS